MSRRSLIASTTRYGAIPPALARSIIMSRLLVLQSKRLIANSCHRRLTHNGRELASKRLEELDSEIESAQHRYRSAILNWESPESQDYWLTAYGCMMDIGRQVIAEMRDGAVILPVLERSDVAAEVEALERMVEGWSNAMRNTIAESVA